MSLPADRGGLDDDGFRVSLEGAALPDFVQMECLAQSNRVFRITSGHRIGYLFFNKGQMIHALSGDHVGEAAALEILKWRDGSVEPCSVGWPDARRSTRPGRVYCSFRPRRATNRGVTSSCRFRAIAARLPASSGTLRSDMTKLAKREGPSMSAPPEFTTTLARAISGLRSARPGGQHRQRKRGLGRARSPVAAYTARLAELIGNMLGMEGFSSLECSFPKDRVFLHRERSGNLVALKVPADAEVGALRERFGV